MEYAVNFMLLRAKIWYHISYCHYSIKNYAEAEKYANLALSVNCSDINVLMCLLIKLQ